MTVWIYDQGEDLKVFATEEAAQAWLDKHDPEGVAFEYEVIGPAARTEIADQSSGSDYP